MPQGSGQWRVGWAMPDSTGYPDGIATAPETQSSPETLLGCVYALSYVPFTCLNTQVATHPPASLLSLFLPLPSPSSFLCPFSAFLFLSMSFHVISLAAVSESPLLPSPLNCLPNPYRPSFLIPTILCGSYHSLPQTLFPYEVGRAWGRDLPGPWL